MNSLVLWRRVAVTLAFLVSAAVAQDPARPGADRGTDARPPRPDDDGPPPPPPFGPPPNPLLIAMDTDQDGELSAKEIARASETLKTLDRNKDGKLSEIEFRPPPPPGQRRGAGAGPGGGAADSEAFLESILRFDQDKDGKVTAKELPERMRRLLESGDTNDDGALDRTEIERISRRTGRPGPPPPPPPPPPSRDGD